MLSRSGWQACTSRRRPAPSWALQCPSPFPCLPSQGSTAEAPMSSPRRYSQVGVSALTLPRNLCGPCGDRCQTGSEAAYSCAWQCWLRLPKLQPPPPIPPPLSYASPHPRHTTPFPISPLPPTVPESTRLCHSPRPTPPSASYTFPHPPPTISPTSLTLTHLALY